MLARNYKGHKENTLSHHVLVAPSTLFTHIQAVCTAFPSIAPLRGELIICTHLFTALVFNQPLMRFEFHS